MRRLAPVLALMLLAAPRSAWACPVCFGQSDSPLASATNLGIIVMLVVITAVLAGFATFIVYLNRRANRATVDAGAAAFAQPRLATSTPQEGIAQC